MIHISPIHAIIRFIVLLIVFYMIGIVNDIYDTWQFWLIFSLTNIVVLDAYIDGMQHAL